VPPVTLALIVSNVAVYLLQAAWGPQLVVWFALWPPLATDPGLPQFQVWQLVSYSFLHGGLTHLAFNMLALYMLGADVERLFGSGFYLRFYLASVVAGALAHLAYVAFSGAPPLPTVGASGGMFGVLLAFGWFFPQRVLVLLFPPIPLPARVFVALYGALELGLGVSGTGPGVAHFAHLGGMAGGWLAIQHRRGRFPFGPRR